VEVEHSISEMVASLNEGSPCDVVAHSSRRQTSRSLEVHERFGKLSRFAGELVAERDQANPDLLDFVR
jgi:hypothetical protein